MCMMLLPLFLLELLLIHSYLIQVSKQATFFFFFFFSFQIFFSVSFFMHSRSKTLEKLGL